MFLIWFDPIVIGWVMCWRNLLYWRKLITTKGYSHYVNSFTFFLQMDGYRFSCSVPPVWDKYLNHLFMSSKFGERVGWCPEKQVFYMEGTPDGK